MVDHLVEWAHCEIHGVTECVLFSGHKPVSIGHDQRQQLSEASVYKLVLEKQTFKCCVLTCSKLIYQPSYL